MEKEKLEAMLVELIDGTLPAQERERLETEIRLNPDTARLFEQTKQILTAMDNSAQYEPSSLLRANFLNNLQVETAKQKGERVVSFSISTVYRIAAGVVLVIASGLVIFWMARNNEQEQRLARMEEELKRIKAEMIALLQNPNSAGQRLQGVSVSLQISKVDDEIVEALVSTLETDPNTNVRLAALEALARFHEQPHVRSELIMALGVQKDPAVQIALIRLLVEIKAKDSLKELERITTDELLLPAVKDEAHAGILKLS